jgi:hypothetical protein
LTSFEEARLRICRTITNARRILIGVGIAESHLEGQPLERYAGQSKEEKRGWEKGDLNLFNKSSAPTNS